MTEMLANTPKRLLSNKAAPGTKLWSFAATNGAEGDALLWAEVLQRKTGVQNLEMTRPVLQLGDFVQDRDLRRTWGIGQQKQGDTQLGKQQEHRGPDTGTDAGNKCSMLCIYILRLHILSRAPPSPPLPTFGARHSYGCGRLYAGSPPGGTQCTPFTARYTITLL